jgi:epoxyqueuosine reductase
MKTTDTIGISSGTSEEASDDIRNKLKKLLKENGAGDIGFTEVDDGVCGLNYALSIVVPLSDAIIDEIDKAPTHTYFNHYRTVNAYIDRLLLASGLFLQQHGYKYITIAASQTINNGLGRTHMGRYSHKKAAVLSGLGTIGKNSLFIHSVYGTRVRLGTLFTDCRLTDGESKQGIQNIEYSHCGTCDLCVKTCPAKAIKGVEWHAGIERSEIFDADACNNYMRQHFMNIGRGSVCGICIKVCNKRGIIHD